MKRLVCEDLKATSAQELLSYISNLLATDICCDDCKLEIIMQWLEDYYESI